MYNFPIKEVGKEFIKRLLRVSVDLDPIKGKCGSTTGIDNAYQDKGSSRGLGMHVDVEVSSTRRK